MQTEKDSHAMTYSTNITLRKFIQKGVKSLALSLLILLPLGTIAQKKSAHIDLQFHDQDSVKFITTKVREQVGDSLGQPVEGLDLFFYVQRTFRPLPLGNVFNTTDENGEVTIEFPSDLPADTLGNVTILVKIEDAEEYRDTTLKRTVHWGIPLKIDPTKNKRTLWAARANAPISLILLVNSILLVVWGLIFYIVFQLIQIRKEK